MAVPQRLTAATSRRGQCNEDQRGHRQRECLKTPRRQDPVNQMQGSHGGTDDNYGAGIVSWQAVIPPFFCSPPHPIAFWELMPSFNLYGSYEDQAVGDSGNEHRGTLEVFDGFLMPDLTFMDVQQQWRDWVSFRMHSAQFPECAFFLQPPVMQELCAHYPAEAYSLTDELYNGGDVDGEEPQVMSCEGWDNVRVEPAAIFQPDPRHSIPDSYYGPLVSSCGTISVFLRHHVRVDISLDNAVRVVNYATHCTAVIGSSSNNSCVCHPCGRVLQEGDEVHMAMGVRLAKISRRGVIFTALGHGLVYLVDTSGIKSTTERFHNLAYDLTQSVFNFEPQPDVDSFKECFQRISQARHRTAEDGSAVWTVAGVRMKQTSWGDVQVSRRSGRRMISTSPGAGTISLNTPLVKAALSYDDSEYVSVKTERKKLSVSAGGLIVRNGSQRAGFDSRGRLTLP